MRWLSVTRERIEIFSVQSKLFIEGAWARPKLGAAFRSSIQRPNRSSTRLQPRRRPMSMPPSTRRAGLPTKVPGRIRPAPSAAVLRPMTAGIRARQAELARLELDDNGKPFPRRRLGHRRRGRCAPASSKSTAPSRPSPRRHGAAKSRVASDANSAAGVSRTICRPSRSHVRPRPALGLVHQVSAAGVPAYAAFTGAGRHNGQVE